MNIMIVEEGFGSEIHAKPIANALAELGHVVNYHQWLHPVFRSNDNFLTYLLNILYRVDARFRFGPLTVLSNFYICILCIIIKPQILFVYRGRNIFPITLQFAKFLGCTILGYNNDDPFSDAYHKCYWANYKACLKYYHYIFAYRESNQKIYQENNVPSSVLLPFYSSKVIFASEAHQAFSCDVLFVGHFEDDGRDEILLKLLKAGINLKIYGPNWRKSNLILFLEEYLQYEIVPLSLKDYNLALNSTKIALVFLSKLNNDKYTRRCFEIPVTNAVMLAPYSRELNALFTENYHALYYRAGNDLGSYITTILKDCETLNNINIQSKALVDEIGHSELDRAKLIVDVIKRLH